MPTSYPLQGDANSADSLPMPHDSGNGKDENGEYSELVQRAYENLFELWLKPERDPHEDTWDQPSDDDLRF
jgi:hypothetical protein